MILVVSAATHPEPRYMAAALAEAGHEVQFATAASFAADEWPMRLARLLPDNRASAEVLRRELPHGLEGKQIQRGGYVQEVAHLWHKRVRNDPSRTWTALQRRNSNFLDRVVTKTLPEASPRVVIAQQESASRVFEAAPDALKILSYPIAHHRWLDRELRRERELHPEWASEHATADTMEPERAAALDREIELADKLVVGSTFVKETCVSEGVDPGKVVVVPLGAPPIHQSDAAPPDDLFPQDAGLKILFAGQIIQRKGIIYLVEAFEALDRPDAALTLIGSADKATQRRLEAHPRVRVIAPVPQANLMAAQAAADVLALPSLGEGFPLVAIEAMTMGTAVVVSDATFGHDVVTDGVNGYVVPMRDADALADVLRLMADDPARTSLMGRNAAERAADFTWARYRERFIAAAPALGI